MNNLRNIFLSQELFLYAEKNIFLAYVVCALGYNTEIIVYDGNIVIIVYLL